MTIQLNDIFIKLTQSFPDYNKRTIYIAFSGGLDSSTILHIFYKLKKQKLIHNLKAIHVNHNLQKNSASWEDNCASICSQFGIDLIVEHIKLESETNIEANARDLRYKCFAKHLEKNDILILAHHQQDQAETFLLHTFKGSGLKGLCSIPKIRKLEAGHAYRPLLNINREHITAYAKENNLTWINDHSNTDTKFNRNYIRHKVLETITPRWPAAVNCIARTIQHCNQAQALITEFIQPILNERTRLNTNILSIIGFHNMSAQLQDHIILSWLDLCAVPKPNSNKISEVRRNIVLAKQDKQPAIYWDKYCIRRYQKHLYLLKNLVEITTYDIEIDWNISENETLILPRNLGELTIKTDCKNGIDPKYLKNVVVSFKQTGQRCQPTGRIGSHPIKKLFQEWKIPPWERHKIPIIKHKNNIISIANHCICHNVPTHKNGIMFAYKPTFK